MAYTFKRAIREQVSLILALAGGTGSGKTMSALRLATGMSQGKPFAIIDTENGRASHYADQFTFDTCDLRAPFHPEAYTEAILAADKAGYPVIVVDSMSHEHAGEGGLLDMHEEELNRMAGDDWKKRDACKMTAWVRPKSAHKKLMNSLLQVRAHVILCFRAEERIEMVRDPQSGKMEVRAKQTLTGKDGWVPICEKTVPFEATCSFLLLASEPGRPHPIKLPEQMKSFVHHTPLDEKAGELLAQWATGGQAETPQQRKDAINEAKGIIKGLMGDMLNEEPSHQSADLEILKADFDRNLKQAQGFKEAAAVRDKALSSSLPTSWKDGFKLRFQEKFRQA